MSRQSRRAGKPQGMTYAEKLARERMLREVAQNAANDLTVQVRADIHTQKMAWLNNLALNDEFGFGKERFARLAAALHKRAMWYEELVRTVDDDYANVKLKQEAERVTQEHLEFAWEEEIEAARKKHRYDTLTNYERLRYSRPREMAAKLCDFIDCAKCPGREFCKHDGIRGNGLYEWLKKNEVKEVTE